MNTRRFTHAFELISGCKNILNQLVSHYIKDRTGKSDYDGEPYLTEEFFPGYTGIMRCIKKLAAEATLHIHTLNHDLFFEGFNHTVFLQGNLSDGFEEFGSPYYGDIQLSGRRYKCRIPYYSGKYKSNIRLYKLHGSLDYAVFHGDYGVVLKPENYVKTQWGIGFTSFVKEKNIDGEYSYHEDWINFHADFLTGTTSKIQRYQEPLLYQKLFDLFRTNLNESEKWIIIGYGGKDSEINNILCQNFDPSRHCCVIIDLFPSEKVKELSAKLNATLIVKNLNDIEMTDLMCQSQ